jgi:hypothetical protein
MKAECPSLDEMISILAGNGRQQGLRKHVLDGGWWFIDESAPAVSKTQASGIPPEVEPATVSPECDAALSARLLSVARADGWKVPDTASGPYVDIGGKRRAKAELVSVAGRGPSLCVAVLHAPCALSEGTAAYILHLTAFLRRVRASVLDFGRGPQPVWEAPFDPTDPSEEHLIEALCCLAEAVRHGQAEAQLMNLDRAIAARWLETRFSRPIPRTTNNK